MNVVTAGPMPPEAQAYALARYSRSADTFAESLAWVKAHDSGKFFETYYFKYGHPSIADLGHLAMSLEGISEVAAVEAEDEQLWDGQAKSTRYQDFSKVEPVIPTGMNAQEKQGYCDTFEVLIKAYKEVRSAVLDDLWDANPKPAGMKDSDYERALGARAFDVARYLLPMGIPTNVGQVVSIRTLEKQIRRLLASPYGECRELAGKMKVALNDYPQANFYLKTTAYGNGEWADDQHAVAPTLAKYLEPDTFQTELTKGLKAWYSGVVKNRWSASEIHESSNNVRLYRMGQSLWETRTISPTVDAIATLLYTKIDGSCYEELLSFASSLKHSQIQDAFRVVEEARGPHDELPREFRNQPYMFELTMDIGAYRDLHRHRRCQQFRQPYGTLHGYEIPSAVIKSGILNTYLSAMDRAHETFRLLWPGEYAAYILPFGTRVRTLFKMDFAEAEYICKLRSKVGGHFSYRRLVWEMAEQLKRAEPYLGRLITATNPAEEAPLCR